MTDPTPVPAGDDDDERTTVVDRSAPADEGNETIVVDRSLPRVDDGFDGTVVVDRSAPTDEGNETIVVDRSLPRVDDGFDGTVVVDRSASSRDHDDDEHDGTLVVDRSTPDRAHDEVHDGTVVVARPASGKSANGTSAGESSGRPADSPRRGRRRITLPPVEPGFGPDAVDAVGVGAIDSYVPRPIEPAPVAAPAIPLGADATRAPAPSMPSVQRRSRLFGAIAVGGFVLACVVSVTGLATIVVGLVS